jgi:Zn-dependent protease
MDEKIRQFLIFFPIILFSIAVHEFAHCWITDRLGDDTPRLEGRVTFAPWKHWDLFGTIMIAVSSFSGIGFGWGKSSPMNPMNFRHPERDRMISAVVGPISNLLQMLAWASLGLLVQRLPMIDDNIMYLLQEICFAGLIINLMLAAFNLLPVYPLDGHHIASYLLPALRPIIDNPIWGFVFLFLVFNKSILSTILEPVMKYGLVFTQFLIGWPSWTI